MRTTHAALCLALALTACRARGSILSEQACDDPPLGLNRIALTASVRDGTVRRLGYSIDAFREMPDRIRYIVSQDRDGTVRSWLITDGGQLRLPRTSLTPEEAALPVGTIWNHPLLVARLETGWSPRTV